MPMARLILEALAPANGSFGSAAGSVFTSAQTWIAIENSLIVSIGGTALAVTIGAVVAVLVSLTDMRSRNAFVFCFVLPFMIAPQVTALAWLQVFGPSSALLRAVGLAPTLGSRNPLYSLTGIVFLLGVQYAPLMFLVLRAGLRSMPQDLVDAARACGATPAYALRTVILPLMLPSIFAGVALCFVSCLGNFGIPAFLGTPGNIVTLPTLIYQRLAGQGPAVLTEVSLLSLVIGGIAIGGIAVQSRLSSRHDVRIVSLSRIVSPFNIGRWRPLVAAALWLLIALTLILPMAGLVSMSLVKGLGVKLTAETASLSNYAYVLLDHAATKRALRNSFALSMAAAAIIVVVALPLGYFSVWRRSAVARHLTTAVEMVYAVPGVVLAIALILLFLRPVPLIGVSIYNTVWIILIAYVGRFLVLGLRPILGGYRQMDRKQEEAAAVIGASLFQRFAHVIAPALAPVIAAGFLLVFLSAFNELTVSALLWSSGAETLGVVLFSFEQGGDAGEACTLAVLTVLLTVLLMLLTAAMGRRLPPGVLPWRG
ncbi:MAG: iron ABC transporter permease [Beijerinckiaceae bacterium]|nr:iron ABC transporter permease [Beijerinckiaceae bacterium]